MESLVLICIFGLVLLFVPILAIVALFQSRQTGVKFGWRVALPAAVLADWFLLIAWHPLGTSDSIRRWLSTPLTDVFLLFSLLMLVLSAVTPIGRWKLLAATLLVLSFWIWTEQRQALVDDGSYLSVLISRVTDKAGFSAGPNAFTVLHKMRNYQKRGHYDAAIDAAKAWAEEYPRDGFNDRVFVAVAWMFLNKAQHDRAHAEDYVNTALLYRDKALLIATDTTLPWSSIWTLRDLALISKAAGDISLKQRCVQYGNALKLLQRRADLLRDRQDEISRRFVPVKDDLSVEDCKCMSDETQTAIGEVREQQQKYACK
jgi:hypothetical protein